MDRRRDVEPISLESAVSVFAAEFDTTETAGAALYEVEVVRPANSTVRLGVATPRGRTVDTK